MIRHYLLPSNAQMGCQLKMKIYNNLQIYLLSEYKIPTYDINHLYQINPLSVNINLRIIETIKAIFRLTKFMPCYIDLYKTQR